MANLSSLEGKRSTIFRTLWPVSCLLFLDPGPRWLPSAIKIKNFIHGNLYCVQPERNVSGLCFSNGHVCKIKRPQNVFNKLRMFVVFLFKVLKKTALKEMGSYSNISVGINTFCSTVPGHGNLLSVLFLGAIDVRCGLGYLPSPSVSQIHHITPIPFSKVNLDYFFLFHCIHLLHILNPKWHYYNRFWM